MTRPDASVIICAISRKAAILYHIVKENCIQIPSQLDICMVPSSCLFLLYIVGWLQCWVHKYPGWLLVLVSSEECPRAECCMWPVRNHVEKSLSLLASHRPYTVKSIYLYNKLQTDRQTSDGNPHESQLCVRNQFWPFFGVGLTY